MSDNNQAAPTDLIYGLDAKPPALQAFFAGLQHLMAIFVGIVTPPIIISGALGLDVQQSSFIISMALFASGISTFIQVKKVGPIGSGLLSIQGTSFTFLGSVIAAGLAVKAGGGTIEAALATIFAVCFFGSFVEMIFSRFIPFLKKIITPLVSGIVVTLIGMSLIRVGITDIAGGQYVMDNVPDAFATLQNLGLAAIVLVVIVFLNRSKNNFLRMSAIFTGLVVGYIVAAAFGKVNFGRLAGLAIIQAPIPLRYGLGNINWGVMGASLIPMMLLYLITTVESIGDLTATSMVSGEPIEGELYMKRIAGGVLGDGVNSAIAAIFNSFPNTTFSQNNGVIQMTGVASRKVGFWIAGMLAVVGLFPIVGGLFSIIPASVLGGATIIMFGTVAAAGIRIIASSTIDRRGVLIMAISFGLGLGVAFVPEVLKNFSPVFKSIFGSAITTGGLSAIFLNIVLPRSLRAQKVGNPPSTGFEDVN
ncbi:MAG: nucleobase:cation symporter-2 family protein [Spirochaetaceae bacterium]|nr:nucleobase:cation symporter-2 family protein [Spirochaetaceae bacterium]